MVQVGFGFVSEKKEGLDFILKLEVVAGFLILFKFCLLADTLKPYFELQCSESR